MGQNRQKEEMGKCNQQDVLPITLFVPHGTLLKMSPEGLINLIPCIF